MYATSPVRALIAVLVLGSCLLLPVIAGAQGENYTLLMVTLKPEVDPVTFEKALKDEVVPKFQVSRRNGGFGVTSVYKDLGSDRGPYLLLISDIGISQKTRFPQFAQLLAGLRDALKPYGTTSSASLRGEFK
jgi:hypothetical protein